MTQERISRRAFLRSTLYSMLGLGCGLLGDVHLPVRQDLERSAEGGWLEVSLAILQQNPFLNWGSIACFGDSISTASAYGDPQELLRIADQERTELRISSVQKVAGLGFRMGYLGGDQMGTDQMLPQILENLCKDPTRYPWAAVIMLGTNDCQFFNFSREESLQSWIGEVDAITENLSRAGIIPILSTIPPITKEGYCESNREYINYVIADYALRRGFPLRIVASPDAFLHSQVHTYPLQGLSSVIPLLPTENLIEPEWPDYQDGIHIPVNMYDRINRYTLLLLNAMFQALSGRL